MEFRAHKTKGFVVQSVSLRYSYKTKKTLIYLVLNRKTDTIGIYFHADDLYQLAARSEFVLDPENGVCDQDLIGRILDLVYDDSNDLDVSNGVVDTSFGRIKPVGVQSAVDPSSGVLRGYLRW